METGNEKTKNKDAHTIGEKIAKCVRNRNCLRFLLAIKFAVIGE